MKNKISRWQTIGFKFSLTLLLSSILVFVGVISLANSQNKYNTAIYTDRQAERKESFKIISTLESQPLKGLAIENTYWDEMVNFANRPNPEFEKEIFESQLANYEAAAIWVYNSDGQLVSNVNRFAEPKQATNLNLTASNLEVLFRESYLTHFFRNTPVGMLEVYGATIHNSDNPSHTGKPQGYFFVSRKIDDAYVQRLEIATKDQIQLISINNIDQVNKPTVESGKIQFQQPLLDENAQPVGYFLVSYNSKAIATLFKSSTNSIIYLLISVTILSVIVFAILRFIIIRPLSIIHNSLSSENTNELAELMHKESEFGKIAILIEKAQRQKQEIIEASKQMQQAQSALESRSYELESINKLMINRELRMVELKQEIAQLKSQLDSTK